MNFEDDKAWETRLDGLLKDLPELPAPANLVEKTIATLDEREKASLSYRPWPAWPMWLRAVSLAFMLAVVGGLCAIKWEFARVLFASSIGDRLSTQFTSWGVTFGVLNTLGQAALTVARHANTWWILLGAFTAVMAYCACVGIGTAAVRLTFARRS